MDVKQLDVEQVRLIVWGAGVVWGLIISSFAFHISGLLGRDMRTRVSNAVILGICSVVLFTLATLGALVTMGAGNCFV